MMISGSIRFSESYIGIGSDVHGFVAISYNHGSNDGGNMVAL